MKVWTILICTIQERARLFEILVNKLKSQIVSNAVVEDIDIAILCDNRKLTIGEKRNLLVAAARSVYISFIDDDDDIAPTYVSHLYKGIKQNKDCVALEGIITSDGNNPKRFTHSIQYRAYQEINGVYYRPPNHLNVVRRDLVKDFIFPEKNFSEDYDWSMQICRAKVLKTEAKLPEPVYFYRSVTRKCKY